MKYQAVLYDMDGTLFDTGEGIYASVRQVVADRGLPPLDDATLQSFVGPPVQKSFQRVFGLSEEEAWSWADDFRTIYKGDNLLLARTYDGIEQLVKTLHERGIPQMVATNKRQDYAERLLAAMGLDAWIDRLFGSDMDGRLTKADIVGMAADATGAPRDQVLMVGDTEHDAAGAKAQGIAFLGVTYGYGFASEQDVDAFDNVGAVGAPLDIMEYVS